MVQNTVGRIYLDNNPYETALQKKWQYLVEPSEKTPAESILRYEELTDLKVADLACGSGHILNECFDLLYDLYIAEGYGRGEAIENIFKHNLTGIDIDNRAKQLATFALLLKACQKNASFADAHCLPHVWAMPKPWDEEKNGLVREFLPHFFLGQENQTHVNELIACFDLMQHADSLGSIMKFELSDSTQLLVKQTVEYWYNQNFIPEAIRAQLPAFELILALTEKYHALVMNPPYMGAGSMNEVLSKYVKKNYSNSKTDLMAVFMEVCILHLYEKGKYGMINLPSWLFLSSFEALRKDLISNYHIDSLLHMGRGIFGIDWGSTCFIVTKAKSSAKGVYFKLHQRTFQHIYFTHIGQLFLQVQKNHELKYDFTTYRDEDVTNIDVYNFKHSNNGLKLYFEPNQSDFEKIPGCPIGYWISPNILRIFTSNLALSAVASPCVGLQTADNARFLRLWFEVSRSRIGFGFENAASAARSGLKWFPITKGGPFRRWYGNMTYVVNWENNGKELKNFKGSVIRNEKRYFTLSGCTWSTISSGKPSFRYFDKSWLFETKGSVCFPNDENIIFILMGYLNSPITFACLQMLSPTLDYHEGPMGKIPFKNIMDLESISTLACKNMKISKSDWDAHETSWDFQHNELLNMDVQIPREELRLDSIEWRMEQYKKKWEQMFCQLHENEEELNRQFIEIYGLQDELTPDVPIDEITILQQGEVSFVPSAEGEDAPKVMKWNDDVIIKQLISYAVGCMMGRYRLDKPGLHIAHPEPTAEEIAPYSYHGRKYDIDDDGILPLMNSDCGFSDNAPLRMADFVRIAFGEETQVENLNYMEQCLGKTLEQYFVKDFWKDHKKMYQNRPIYWLFASKKGTFQVIAYMHRMNAYTVERIRAKYLLPFIEHLEQETKKLDMRRAELTTKESKQLQTLQKQLDECREYHERLQVVAEQAISFDLDDGVVVNYAKFGDVLQKIK